MSMSTWFRSAALAVVSVLALSACSDKASEASFHSIDITGAVPGSYWNVDAERAVGGWSVNPAYGPMPTMRLSYTRATSAVTTGYPSTGCSTSQASMPKKSARSQAMKVASQV